MLALNDTLGPAAACEAAFASPTHFNEPSVSHRQISTALREVMGLSVEDEFQCPKSRYFIDMMVQDTREGGSSTSGRGAGTR